MNNIFQINHQESQQHLVAESDNSIRQTIRQQKRDQRKALSKEQQLMAEKRIAQQALALIDTRKAKCVALYLSFDGEVSTQLLIQFLWEKGIKVCLPILHPFSKGHLLFMEYTATTEMNRNAFGISEPVLDIRSLVLENEIDIIFTPLVAFDKSGNRLGMGGGFYDRTLQNWQDKHYIPVGLAHRCQEMEQLPIASWDIPLAAILSA